jgi:N-sulfoglucosamine sulfohydrolase
MQTLITRRDLPISAAVTSAAVLAIAKSFAETPASKSRPNLLLFTSDDLGMQVGCYGDPFARTAHHDRLAAQGVRFETAYVTQSSCSPSRSSMLTGLYPHQNGQIGLATLSRYATNPGVVFLPNLLKKAGYSTSVLGKIHIAPEPAIDFDFTFVNEDTYLKRDINIMTLEAQEYIKAAGDKPFFMMYNFIDPHRPLADQMNGLPEKPQTVADVMTLPFLGVDSVQLRSDTAAYYNGVNRADLALGRLIDALVKTGKHENTLIIAIGDNGPPFSRAKTTCYEAGVRTPFILSWPGHFETGSVRSEMVSTVDIMPTFLEAAGIEAPSNLAGTSLLPLLEGKQYTERRYLNAEYTLHGDKHLFPRRCIRDQRFKLIHNLMTGNENPIKGPDGCPAWTYVMTSKGIPSRVEAAYQTYTNPPEFELYDLQTDPYEFNNCAYDSSYKEHLDRLTVALADWQRHTDDPLADPQKLQELIEAHKHNL